MNKYIIPVLIVWWAGLASFLRVIFSDVSSQALGTIIGCVLMFIPLFLKAGMTLKINKNFFLFLAIISVLILLSIVENISNISSSFKTLFSIGMLFFFFYCAFLFSRGAINFQYEKIAQIVMRIFYLLLFIGVLNIIFDFQVGIYTHSKAVIPFSEASHFALFYGVFALMAFVISENKQFQVFILAVTLLMALILPSLTLLVYVFLMVMLKVGYRNNLGFMSFVLLGAVVLMMTMDSNTMNYYVSRIDFWDVANRNLSLLVYLQGIEQIYYSLTHNLFGVGFQNLGTLPITHSGQLIVDVTGSSGGLNREDGGFLVAKIISEFGWPGLVLIIGYLCLVVNSFIKLKISMKSSGLYSNKNYLVFSYSLIYASSVEFFIRGVGYFSPSLFMFFVGLFVLFNYSLRFSNLDKPHEHRQL